MYNVVRAEDILPLKHDLPELVVSKADIRTTRGRPFFGVAPTSPFRDQRVRQAYVMTWDRDLFLDVHMNAKNFRDAGLPVESFWETGLQVEQLEELARRPAQQRVRLDLEVHALGRG